MNAKHKIQQKCFLSDFCGVDQLRPLLYNTKIGRTEVHLFYGHNMTDISESHTFVQDMCGSIFLWCKMCTKQSDGIQTVRQQSSVITGSQ